MNNYENNLIAERLFPIVDEVEKEMLKVFPKAKGWLPFDTYDMVQCGYPYPDHGEMVRRTMGGTNAKNELMPSKGMWCKVEDIKHLLK